MNAIYRSRTNLPRSVAFNLPLNTSERPWARGKGVLIGSIGAISSEVTQEHYAIKGATPDVPRLQRTLVRFERAPR